MKPYYADDWVTLYHGDALAVAQDLPDHSFSAIVTDPPYIRESIYYYDWLAEIDHRLLQPNGVLLIYAGAFADRLARAARSGEGPDPATARGAFLAVAVGLVSFLPLGRPVTSIEANVHYNLGSARAEARL